MEPGIHSKGSDEHILTENDTENGYSFYCCNSPGWLELQNLVNKNTDLPKRNKKVNFKGSGLRNMLSSEYIP